MLDAESYMSRLIPLLKARYADRLAYVGLQGSYLRGEANENSDLDIMVVVDGLTVADLDDYRAIIATLERPDLSCGFICGKADLACWNPLEIAHLLHTTKDYYHTLAPLVPAYTPHDIRRFVQLSVNNLYHALCHSYIHAEREQCARQLPALYKGVFFILQNLYYLEHGAFIPTKAQLLALLSGADAAVLARAMGPWDDASDFPEAFALLFSWCQDTLKRVGSTASSLPSSSVRR